MPIVITGMNRRVQLITAMRQGRSAHCLRNGICIALTAGMPIAAMAAVQEDALVDAINAYRTSSHACEGKQAPPAGPLAPNPALSRVKISPGGQLQDALEKAGYQAGRVQVISVQGPSNADEAMALIRQAYCGLLSSPRYADIGVSHSGGSWQIIFAQPLLSPDLGGWKEAGKAILRKVNDARSTPRTCGKQRFSAAAPLAWNAKLADAALAHSRDMANGNYFGHQAKDGRDAGDRARHAGYAWRGIGENIAAGQGSPQGAVSGWLASPEHCANIMNPDFAEMAAAYAVNKNSDATIYWTQVFGTPR